MTKPAKVRNAAANNTRRGIKSKFKTTLTMLTIFGQIIDNKRKKKNIKIQIAPKRRTVTKKFQPPQNSQMSSTMTSRAAIEDSKWIRAA